MAALREEEEVARRLSRFLSEESLFHEGGRVLRVKRTTQVPGAAPPPDRTGVDGLPSGDPGRGSEDAEFDDSLPQPAPPPPPPPPTTPALPSTQTRIGARPLGIESRERHALGPLSGNESLAELARRERELASLAERLEREADTLEREARALD
jgi:hypothetical protein